jgi:hypothetical protein
MSNNARIDDLSNRGSRFLDKISNNAFIPASKVGQGKLWYTSLPVTLTLLTFDRDVGYSFWCARYPRPTIYSSTGTLPGTVPCPLESKVQHEWSYEWVSHLRSSKRQEGEQQGGEITMRRPSDEEGSWLRRLPNQEDGWQRVIFLMRHSSTRSATQKKWKWVSSPWFWSRQLVEEPSSMGCQSGTNNMCIKLI